MSKFRSKLGLSLLATAICSICIGAFGAGNASALTLHQCESGFHPFATTPRYSTSLCNEELAEGNFKTVPLFFSPSKFTTMTTGETKLRTTIGGVAFEITCTGWAGPGEAKNLESGGSSASEIVWEFSGCTVTSPAGKGCAVSAGAFSSNKLKAASPEMGITFSPESGETIATITIEKCSTPALNGAKALKGTAKATVNEKTPQSQEFTSTSGSSLTFGGQTATFTGKSHWRTEDGTVLAAETP
jgi:hypothetical protein